jgi:MFS transporter, NNP family, nitrate/nitrite transporter
MNVKTPQATRALTAATMAFAANFSVWTLYSVLGIALKDTLDLNATEFGLLLASPILTGALLRFPIGILSESVSCRKLFTWQMLLLVPALFYLPYITTYTEYLVLGLFIGISGTSFTIGIRYVSDWYESKQQGAAMGIFGAGNAGAAITLILAPIIIEFFGNDMIGPIYAVGLLAMAILFFIMAPEVPDFIRVKHPADLESQLKPLKDGQVWRFGLYYYFVFGSFLALIMWLPQYYINAYDVNISQAMVFTLVFVGPSSLVRALGGWFADRYGANAVNWSVFWICLVCLFILSYPETTMTIHGTDGDVNLNIHINVWVFTALIFIIGIAQGFGRASVYKSINDDYPEHMGSVGGTVATIGATGGFTLPILFGLAVDLVGFHSASFMVLYGVLALCMILMHFALKAETHKKRVRQAIATNFLERD